MKYIILVGFLLIGRTVVAQSAQCGIYLTADDFKVSKLTDAVDCKDNDHAINRNSFFNKPYVTISYKGEKKKFIKDKIYGYQDCGRNVFRFFERKEYKILNENEIYLYNYQQLESGTKSANTVNSYFFSISADAKVVPLTILNLQKAFPDNHKFHDSLEAVFKSDNELMRYDSFENSYKLVHVLKESIDN